MSRLIDRNVKTLIDETNDFYSNYGSVNADYAAFAVMALSDFKSLLHRPDLTAQRLRRVLRKADQQHRAMDVPSKSWSIFMARYVRKNVTVNANFNKKVDADYSI